MDDTAPPTALPAAPPAAQLAGAADARAERFLARVALLPPPAWAELHAAGARDAGPGLGARVRRARVTGALVPSGLRAWAPAVTGAVVAAQLAAEVVALLRGAPRAPAWRRRPPDLPPHDTAARQHQRRQLQRLWDLVAASPGGPGPALNCLGMALVACWLSDRVAEGAARRLYGPVQRVIPWASL